MVVGQNHKERNRNLKEALERISVLLVHHHYPKQEKERAPETKLRRTYNEVDNRVVDHKTGDKFSYKNYKLNIGRVADW